MTKAAGAEKAQKLSTFNARSESAAKSFTFGPPVFPSNLEQT
jgi:hypothetical protein